MNHAILGAGEVGKTVAKIISSDDVILFDKGQWEGLSTDCDVLHICIPYSNKFENIVLRADMSFNPKYIIIHSTVKMGTTQNIQYSVNASVAYSPILGRHNGESIQIQYYPKWIACSYTNLTDFEKMFRCALRYTSSDYNSLEFAKSSSTNYMYWNLLYQKVIKHYCDCNALDFSLVYTEWNKQYNAGISLIDSNKQRPVYEYDDNLTPGGHCLPNNIYLNDDFISEWLRIYQEGTK